MLLFRVLSSFCHPAPSSCPRPPFTLPAIYIYLGDWRPSTPSYLSLFRLSLATHNLAINYATEISKYAECFPGYLFSSRLFAMAKGTYLRFGESICAKIEKLDSGKFNCWDISHRTSDRRRLNVSLPSPGFFRGPRRTPSIFLGNKHSFS